MAVTPQQLRTFLDRPWARLRAAKDQHTAAVIARDGSARAFQLAALLRDHALAMGAQPSAADRRADLAAAVDLRRKLDRASRRPRRDDATLVATFDRLVTPASAPARVRAKPPRSRTPARKKPR